MSDPKPNARYDHVFAIIRFDAFHRPDVDPATAITVKKIVLTREVADSEVARLNELNGAKGSIYFWRMTRLERVSQPAGVDAPKDAASAVAPKT